MSDNETPALAAQADEEPVKKYCEKGCGKPFKRLGKWYEDHVSGCDGKQYRPTKRERVAARTPKTPVDEAVADLEKKLAILDDQIERQQRAVDDSRGYRKVLQDTLDNLKKAEKH